MPVLSLAVIADDITCGGARRQHRGLPLRGGLSRLALARTFVPRFFGRDAVNALKPAPEIDIGAARRAEGLMLRLRQLAADRAAAPAGRQWGDGIVCHGSGYRLSAPRCQKPLSRGLALLRARYGGRGGFRARTARRRLGRATPFRPPARRPAASSRPAGRALPAAASAAPRRPARGCSCRR